MAQLCVRLDGLPLAIELAAARSNALSPRTLLERLQGHLELLRTDARDDPDRHRSLHAAIAWSYELLTAEERVLLARLSVFAGDWNVDAAEGVCVGAPIDRPVVLDILLRLVDRSLLVAVEREGQVRYRLLETIRQFAADRLEQDGQTDAVRTRHRDWYLAMAERLGEVGEVAARDSVALGSDYDNLRAGLRWSVELGDAHNALRLGVCLWPLWYYRSMYTEGRAWLASVLALPSAGQSPVQLLATALAGHLAYCQGDLATARTLVEEGLSLARAQHNQRATAVALHVLGLIVYWQGDAATAGPLFEEALQLNQTLGLRRWEVLAGGGLSRVYLELGDYDRAESIAAANLAFHEERGDEWGVAASQRSLGLVVAARGRLAQAQVLCERAFAGFRNIGDKQGMARVRAVLTQVAEDEGDSETALRYAGESLRLARDAGDRLGLARALETLARLAVVAQPLRATCLLGAARRLREAIGASVLPREQQRLQGWVPAARRRLGEQAFASALGSGRAMSLDDVCTEALRREPTKRDCADDASAQHPNSPGRDWLSPREQEVAILVAEGLTNPQIAHTLVVTVRTAEHHVENILAKLGLSSRTQLGVWAVEHGLRPHVRE